MPDEKDTVVEPTETDPSKVNGTAEGEPSTDPVEPKETESDKVDREAYEQLQKELNQTKQELNLRRNKEKELEMERLESEGKWKELAEARERELAEIRETQESAKREQEAKEFREGILKGYDKDVQDIANDLNLYWDDPQSFEEAEAQLKSKLDKIAAKVGSKAPVAPVEEDSPSVSANNPSADPVEATEIQQLRSMSVEDMRKVLPKAESR